MQVMRCASLVGMWLSVMITSACRIIRSAGLRRLGGWGRGTIRQTAQLAADLFASGLFGGAHFGFGFGFDEAAADQDVAAGDRQDGEPEGPLEGAERLAIFGIGFEGHGGFSVA